MVSITIPLESPFKKRLDGFPWINWSEVGREEVIKKEIFEEFLKTGKLSDKDWEFCEKKDWHPVDWLHFKKEFINKMKKRKKGPFIRLNSVEDIFKE